MRKGKVSKDKSSQWSSDPLSLGILNDSFQYQTSKGKNEGTLGYQSAFHRRDKYGDNRCMKKRKSCLVYQF